MKYMLMMRAGRGQGDWGVLGWAPQDLKAHIDFMLRLNKDLTESGELVGAEGLAGPAEARVVRATKGGAPAVTDGPFAEAKEFLAGFRIVDCESAERAYEIAGRASAAPAPGGAPLISRAARLTARRTTGEERKTDAEPRDLDRDQPDRP
jgi:hypothetical protein